LVNGPSLQEGEVAQESISSAQLGFTGPKGREPKGRIINRRGYNRAKTGENGQQPTKNAQWDQRK